MSQKLSVCMLFMAGVMLTRPVYAEQDVVEQVLNSTVESLVDDTELVESVIGNWRISMNRYGVSSDIDLYPNGIIPLAGDKYISTISVAPNATMGQPGWISSRVAAYQRAELKARYEIVNFLGQTVGGATRLDLFEKVAFSEGEIEEVKKLSYYQRMLDKGGQLVESLLDNALMDLKKDYDPEQYNVEEKNIIFSDTLSSKQSGYAARVVTGATTIYSGEGKDENGNYKIIVSLMWTPKLETLARDISNQSYTIPAKKRGKPVSMMIPKKSMRLLGTQGVRVVVNEQGQYTVMAFGQAEPRKTSPARQGRAIEMAQKRANSRAKGYLVSFIKSNVRGEDSSMTGETSREFDDASYGVSNVDEFRQTIESISKPIKLVGLRTVKSWSIKHPHTRQWIAGSIVSWTPSQQASAKKLNEALSGKKNNRLVAEENFHPDLTGKMEPTGSMEVDINDY